MSDDQVLSTIRALAAGPAFEFTRRAHAPRRELVPLHCALLDDEAGYTLMIENRGERRSRTSRRRPQNRRREVSIIPAKPAPSTCPTSTRSPARRSEVRLADRTDSSTPQLHSPSTAPESAPAPLALTAFTKTPSANATGREHDARTRAISSTGC